MSTREQVEHSADRVRSELLLTLEELERRGRAAVDVRHQLETHVPWLIGAGVGVAVLGLAGFGVSRWRSQTRRSRLRRERVRGLLRAWEHPDRLAKGRKKPRLSAELGRRLLLAMVGVVGTQAAHAGVRRLLPPT
jgi:hypothetical protein